jgi:cyd operon protein YbgT
MWYFAWILGLGLAVLLAVINAMLYDAEQCAEDARRNAQTGTTQP